VCGGSRAGGCHSENGPHPGCRRKILSGHIGSRRTFSLADVREVLGKRERGEQGRGKRRAEREMMLGWARARLLRPRPAENEPSQAA
jgi:hypothetical protein